MLHNQRTFRQKLIHYLSMIVMAIALALLIVMIKAYFDGHFDSVESFQKYISAFGYFGPIILTIFQAIQVVLPIMPGFLGYQERLGVLAAAWPSTLCSSTGHACDPAGGYIVNGVWTPPTTSFLPATHK